MHAAIGAILRNNVPMLLVRGQMSDLVTKERADEFISRFPEIDFVDVGGAGHMVAGDRNDIFAGAVVEFLARHAEDRCKTMRAIRITANLRAADVHAAKSFYRP